jgi:membrane protease YdiL (CAAX protease family)
MIKEIINTHFIDKLPESVLYAYVAIAFTVILVRLNYKVFLKKYDDYKAFLMYFISFFTLLFLIPMILIFFFSDDFSLYLMKIGLQFGNTGVGIPILLAGIPLFFIMSLFSVRDPAIQRFYPFSKTACGSNKKFLTFELSYLVFYYFTWEFIFRGILFFPLIPQVGLVGAIAIQSIISTVYHIGHPDKEISGAFAGGIFFGLVAFFTQSFIYPMVLHAFLGITNDTILCFKYHRKNKASDSPDRK